MSWEAMGIQNSKFRVVMLIKVCFVSGLRILLKGIADSLVASHFTPPKPLG